MAILSANSRRNPTATTESSPTTEPSSNPIESPATMDSEIHSDDGSKRDIENASGKRGRSPTETDTCGRNMYSFCYKTDVSIFSEETLDSTLKRDAPSDLDDDASLENELPKSVTRSCSRGDVTKETRKTDTNEKPTSGTTEDQRSDVYSTKLAPTRHLEEVIKIVPRYQMEQCTPIDEKTMSSEIRNLCEEYESTTETRYDDDDDEKIYKTDVTESYEIHSTLNIEEIVNEEEIFDTRESKEKSERDATTNLQMLRRVFRGDSRDSGIGDCVSSNLSTSSQHVNELGISSIIEEEDNENNNVKDTVERMEEFEYRKTSMIDTSGNVQSSISVATPSGVTKASREINRHEGVFNA